MDADNPKNFKARKLGAKFDEGKPRLDLIEPNFELGLGMVMTGGAVMHGENSWKTVPDAESRYLAALKRHVNAIARGEIIDPDSGQYHTDHIAANAMFLRWFQSRAKDADTRIYENLKIDTEFQTVK